MTSDDFSTPAFRKLHSIADRDLISAFETKFGWTIPKDFRDFLLRVNGVKFQSTNVFFPRRARWREEHTLLPELVPPLVWPPKLGDFVSEDLVGNIDLIKGISSKPILTARDRMIGMQPRDNAYGFAKYMPPHLLVIGMTYNQELLCLGCDGDENERVFVWQSDNSSAEEAIAGLSFVADTFRQFLAELVIIE
jgi:hypothetical protein